MDKVLIFTHGIDIDGYGGAILGRFAFEKPDICFAENFNLDELFKTKWKSGELDNCDKIFVVDHCMSYDLCKLIDCDDELKSKITVVDHHKSRMAQNEFDWVFIIDESDKGKCSGTSLFYEYMTFEGWLKATPAFDKFVELTRSYDTWDWTKTNNQDANKLNKLSLALGREKYIELMQEKLQEQEKFAFSKEDEKTIAEFDAWFKKQVDKKVEAVKVIKFDGFNAGYVETEELFKNDIATAVRNSKFAKDEDVDFMLMPISDRGTVSLRNVKEDFDVNKIAQKHGGGGHVGAASFSMENLHLDETEQQ